MIDFFDDIDLPDSDSFGADEPDIDYLESCVCEGSPIDGLMAFRDFNSAGVNSVFFDPIDTHNIIGNSLDVSSSEDVCASVMDEIGIVQSKLDSEDINAGYLENYDLNASLNEESSTVSEDEYNVSFGMHVEDREWNMNKAKWYEDIEKRENHEAELDVQRGDISAARNHIHAAESARKMKEEYIQAAKSCKK